MTLFVVVPIVEILVIALVADAIGNSATVLLLVTLGAVGAWYAKREGLAALRVTRDGLLAGRLPSRQLADGVVALVAGVLLLVPGFLTGVVGLMLLTGPGREAASRTLLARARRRLDLSPAAQRSRRPEAPPSAGSPPRREWHGFRPEGYAEREHAGAPTYGQDRFWQGGGAEVDSDVIDVEWAEETVFDGGAEPVRGELDSASDDPRAF